MVLDTCPPCRVVAVTHYPIRLSQFLKLADIVADGAAAKELIRQQRVSVNSAVELRRGRQLQKNDRVLVDGAWYTCG